MKLIINTDDRYAETEIIVNCSRIGDETEKLLAAIRMLDMKLAGIRDGRQYVIEASDIIYIESTDKRCFLYTMTGAYENQMNLSELETRLADRDFMRASKNCLFNLKHIKSIEPDLDRRLTLTMERDLVVIVSRQYSGLVKEKLEGVYHG
ncbi:MAG: LytTR family transcriptional regulator [Treponema sp.]|nr:LytTR family transcriptional regulator [Treponema sp.]